ncbi:MAG: PAS domain S-box protein, partial [Halobacteriales archaeon]
MTDERRPGSERVPDARYEHLVDHVQDAVVEFELIDGAPVIRSVNRAFVDTFGYEAAEVEGEPLNEWIVPDWREEEARRIDERTAAAQVTSQRVTRETADGLREFLHRSVPYDDPAQDIDGIAIYTDLTDITRHQRRLRVINRVLRHNLRNTANVITGHTTRLLDAFDGATAEETDVAATIERAAARLETLTREAADIERILNGGDEGFEIDCVPLVAQIAADYRRRAPAAAIETDHPESMRVAADTRLRVAVESLVENAIEHNP